MLYESQWITTVITINPEADMDISTIFHDKPSNLTQTHNISLVVPLEERSGDHQSHPNPNPGDHRCLYKILW